MLSDLGTGFDRAEADGVMIVLRSGRPGIFSAGFELNIFAANDAEGSLKMVKTGAELALGLDRARRICWPDGEFLPSASIGRQSTLH